MIRAINGALGLVLILLALRLAAPEAAGLANGILVKSLQILDHALSSLSQI